MFLQLTLVGNLGRDPELRFLPNGTAVCKLSVATSNNYTDHDGQKRKETTWITASVFGKQAEVCSQYLRKGRTVLVEGRLKPDPTTGNPRVFTRKDGTPGASYEVVASVIRFIGHDGNGTEPAGVTPEEDVPFE